MKEKNFRIALADVELFKKQIKVVKELVNEVRLKINKDDFGFIEMTPCNVALIDFKILSSSCMEYDVKADLEIGINILNLYSILKVINKNDIIVLSNDTQENKLIIEAKGKNTKKFSLPIIEIDESEAKSPELKFDTEIKTESNQLKEELKAIESIAESVTFNCYKRELVLSGDGELSRLDTTIRQDENTRIKQEKEIVISKYSIEFLKKILESSILTDDVTIEFSKDYPMRMTFKMVDKFILSFTLAPRIEED